MDTAPRKRCVATRAATGAPPRLLVPFVRYKNPEEYLGGMASKASRRAGARGQHAAQAPSAREWLEIARQDIKGMEVCCRNRLYGASAYHCQQALEKIVKFAVVKYDLSDKPVDLLNHDVIKGLLKQWKESLPVEEAWAKGALELALKLLVALGKSPRWTGRRSVTDKGGDIPSPKDALWAESLGVPLDSPKLTEMSGETSMPPMSLLEKFYARHLPKEAKDIVADVVGAEKKGGRESAILTAYLKPSKLLWAKFKKTNKPHAGHKRLDKKTAEECLFLWILANLDTLLKVTPHEEYGRYPGVLCKKSRTQWYSEHKDAFITLKGSARRAFDELSKMIKY